MARARTSVAQPPHGQPHALVNVPCCPWDWKPFTPLESARLRILRVGKIFFKRNVPVTVAGETTLRAEGNGSGEEAALRPRRDAGDGCPRGSGVLLPACRAAHDGHHESFARPQPEGSREGRGSKEGGAAAPAPHAQAATDGATLDFGSHNPDRRCARGCCWLPGRDAARIHVIPRDLAACDRTAARGGCEISSASTPLVQECPTDQQKSGDQAFYFEGDVIACTRVNRGFPSQLWRRPAYVDRAPVEPGRETRDEGWQGDRAGP